MSAETLSPEALKTPKGPYKPLTDPEQTRQKISRHLGEGFIWNSDFFGVLADTVATVKTVAGNPNDNKPITISGITISHEEPKDEREMKQTIQLSLGESRYQSEITLTRNFDGSVKVLERNRWDEMWDTEGRLRCMDVRGQEFRPPATDITFHRKEQILRALVGGLGHE